MHTGYMTPELQPLQYVRRERMFWDSIDKSRHGRYQGNFGLNKCADDVNILQCAM